MTDMERKVMVRLCAKILTEAELYDADMERFERIEMENREIVGMIRNVGRGGCCAPYFGGKWEVEVV